MLGIVYTPVEIVDFIIRSVNEVLQEEFLQTLGSAGVHILIHLWNWHVYHASTAIWIDRVQRS